MIRRWMGWGAVALVALAPGIAAAQAEKKADPDRYVYATYFKCDPSREWAVDEVAKSVWGPIYDEAVKNGQLNAWGWLAHHTGGPWRRLVYLMAPSIEGLFAAQESLLKAVNDKNSPAARDFGAICSSHDDYIWKRVAGSPPDQNRGQVGFSVYMDCAMAKEERADAIVKASIAPVYDKYVKEGKLVSWGWFSHVVGGEWRRLATMSAKDLKSLMAARGAILDELMNARKIEMEEFSSICDTHQDYIWTIQKETP